MLNGSVAAGTATELSDLDMIVLCNEIKFVSEVIDDVLVEIHYITYDKAIKRLNNYPMEVYKYLDAKIAYDNGKLKEIITCAENIFYHYCVSEKEKREIVYWLNSIRLKLNSAFSKQDILLISYLVSTNLWKVLEGIWALNQKPVPPSSSLYRRYRDLNFIPCPDWFDSLLMGDIESKGRMMMYSIDWILNEMNK
ncbi:hypothetical protein IMSAG250_00515 [Clostridiales bacterium]|nr:hypothetical protein IMSAG250_00515 [Clostridiales bacterium]